MHHNLNNLINIKKQIQLILSEQSKQICLPNIIAVSKTKPINEIMPLIEYGHIHYGENKVQEALEKWPIIKKDFQNIKLHFLGNLQKNKVKFVVPHFDYIHSLDSLKLAKKISVEQKKYNKDLKIFIQVNIGNESQKNGVQISYLKDFYNECVSSFNLNIVGLMCLPPNIIDPQKYFLSMVNLSKSLSLKELSMGMSNDYISAILCGATFVRIGSKIFGKRH